MNSKRVFYSMIAGLVILVGLCAAGAYFANDMIVSEGNSLKELKLQDTITKKQIDNLQQAKKEIIKFEELEKIAKTVVPQEKDQARTVFELVTFAKESGITLESISFPESELGIVKKGGKASDNTSPDLTQLVPVDGLKGVYGMEIIITSDTRTSVKFDRLLDYLRKLETNRRTAQVASINITPNDVDNSLIDFTLTLNSFVKPGN